MDEEDIQTQEHDLEDEDSSPDDDSDDGGDEETERQVAALRDQLCTEPFNYQAHVDLIGLLRQSGDLDGLREARENMSQRFPLAEDIWLEWIKDEQSFAATDEDKEKIIALFNRAVQDYQSVALWLEYVAFMLGFSGTDEGKERIRATFENGLSAIGVHTASAYLFWETYRDFEMASADPSDQGKRILELFKRQLSVPLIGLESTMKAFEEWCTEIGTTSEDEVQNVKRSYEKSLKELEKLIPFENELSAAEKPRRQQYLNYLDYCESHLTPNFCQCLFERAITENCLDAEIWQRYITYLNRKVKIDSLTKETISRSVRNCPWASSLWISYFEFLEQTNSPTVDVSTVFEQALAAGLPTASDFSAVWNSYLDYRRRATDFENTKDVENLRKTFDAACQHLSSLGHADPGLLQYLAKIEAKFCKNMDNARTIWNDIMSIHENSNSSHLWLEYYQLELQYGNQEEADKVLRRALHPHLDWPETIGNFLVRKEKEEGTLESYRDALSKYSKLMTAVAKKREKLEGASSASISDEPGPSTADKSAKKRKPETEGFKVPEVPTKKSKQDAPASKEKEAPKFLKPSDKSDVVNTLQTVFLSNLDYNVDEDVIREHFGKFGEITDCRLVLNYKGKPKGFCYVEYKTIAAAKMALKNDRTPINGRPVFVNEVGKKKQFQFQEGVEKHKLFVRNLTSDTDASTLDTVFSKYGEIKDIRIVTYRNGHSKGCAYVEFKDELTAQRALKADGTLVKGKNIEVAISDPKQGALRRAGREPPKPNQVLGGGRLSGGDAGGRKRISAPFIPNIVRRKTAPGPNGTNGH